jgi:hypothetical protein
MLNGEKVMCPQGHEYNHRNTYVYTDANGRRRRYCRRCRRIAVRRWKEFGPMPKRPKPVPQAPPPNPAFDRQYEAFKATMDRRKANEAKRNLLKGLG